MDHQKLDAGQKHTLELISRDADKDGWAEVSAMLYSYLERNTPKELVIFEKVGEDGAGRAKLTQAGQNIIESMAWL